MITYDLGRVSIDLNNDWAQFFGKYNWITFNAFKLYAEKENQFGMFEVELYILGFGIRVYWTWDVKRLNEKVKEYQNILDDGEFKTFEDLE